MEPTNAEIIFYCVMAVIGIIFLIKAMCTPSDCIEITWGQRRDWERNEKRWSK